MNREGNVRISRFENGLRVVSHRRPGAVSAAVGIWAAAGSRYESPDRRGISHLLEHALFTGCEGFGPDALAERCAALGGQVNAGTDRQWLALSA